MTDAGTVSVNFAECDWSDASPFISSIRPARRSALVSCMTGHVSPLAFTTGRLRAASPPAG